MTFHDRQLPSGIRLHYARQGPDEGPTVILLHGLTDSSFSFSRVMPLLPAEMQVIAPDLRGHGDSDRPIDGYSLDDMATDVIQLMDTLDIPSAVVVGHSMGSFVARRVAARAPGRVTGLLLIGAAPSPDNAVVRELQKAIAGLDDPVDPAFVREFQESTVARDVPAAFLDRVVAESRKLPARVWAAAVAGLLAFQPADQAIRCATLVVGGTRDAVFSTTEQESMRQQIPGAIVDITDGIGHALHWEDPERFAAALSRVIKSAALVRR
jgi:non-heme chloroperoxidase